MINVTVAVLQVHGYPQLSSRKSYRFKVVPRQVVVKTITQIFIPNHSPEMEPWCAVMRTLPQLPRSHQSCVLEFLKCPQATYFWIYKLILFREGSFEGRRIGDISDNNRRSRVKEGGIDIEFKLRRGHEYAVKGAVSWWKRETRDEKRGRMLFFRGLKSW